MALATWAGRRWGERSTCCRWRAGLPRAQTVSEAGSHAGALPLQRGGLQRKKAGSAQPATALRQLPGWPPWAWGWGQRELPLRAKKGAAGNYSPAPESSTGGCRHAGLTQQLWNLCPHLQVGTALTRTAMGLAPPVARNTFHTPRTQGPGEPGPHTALLHIHSRQSLTTAHFTRVPASRNLVFKRQIATLGQPGNSSKSTELPNDPALNSTPRFISSRTENTQPTSTTNTHVHGMIHNGPRVETAHVSIHGGTETHSMAHPHTWGVTRP